MIIFIIIFCAWNIILTIIILKQFYKEDSFWIPIIEFDKKGIWITKKYKYSSRGLRILKWPWAKNK